MRIAIVCLLLAATVAAAVFLVSGQSTLDELRVANLSLQEEINARTAASNLNPAESPSNTVADFSTQELNELLRLRGQIQPLRSECAGLSNRLVQLAPRSN
jgi:hypothetical protein